MIKNAETNAPVKPLSIALCNEVVRGLSFRKQCSFARAVGYNSLEIAPFTLGNDPNSIDFKNVDKYRRIAEEEGIAISGLHWLLAAPGNLSITSRDQDVHRRTLEMGRSLIALCRDLGGQYLVHGSPAQRKLDAGFEDEGRKRGAAYFAELADEASIAKVDYIIEPLSQNITNFITTVDEAADIIADIGSSSLLTMIDCYAAASDNDDICKLIEHWLPSGLIRHIHFNDDNARGPGEGSIAFAPILATLSRFDYTGTCAVEPFEYEPDGPACAARAIGYLRGLSGVTNTMISSNVPVSSGNDKQAASGRKQVAARGKARRDPKATRASILMAARKEFSDKGLKGGRVDQIANSAGINKQLVYYYFGSKDELYKAALEATYKEIRKREHELDLSQLAPKEAIVSLIDFSLSYLDEHRDFIRMLTDENNHGARHLHSSDIALQTNSPLLEMIDEVLKRGEALGDFRSGIDPLELYVSIAGMTFFYFSNGLTLAAIFGRDLTTRESVDSYRNHIVTLTLEGLRP